MAEHARRCPKTLAALDHVPLTRIKGRAPSILFSMLRPGTRIEPHNGFLNTRLICHVPLIVPPGCFFRVGNEERQWQKGKAWAFDDTIEHEAWNSSDEARVILIFDIWRPNSASGSDLEFIAPSAGEANITVLRPPTRNLRACLSFRSNVLLALLLGSAGCKSGARQSVTHSRPMTRPQLSLSIRRPGTTPG